jgi:hypothetical protein
MSAPCRHKVVNLPILGEPDVQASIVGAADDHRLWGVLLPLVEMMNATTRAMLASIIAAQDRTTLQGAGDAALMGEQWDSLLDLAALMPQTKQDELAAIVRSFGEVDPDLLRRVAHGANQRGFGARFEATGVAPSSASRTGASRSSACS